MPKLHVAVLGGGVAGLTAAHELLKRGCRVTLCERRKIPGGKARSYAGDVVDLSGDPLKLRAPAEHGFRFFPGFYRHLDHTMGQIPLPARFRSEGRTTALDYLVPARDELLAVTGRAPLHVPAARPKTFADARRLARSLRQLLDLGLTEEDFTLFVDKLWQIATSCVERRNEEYERIGWREFVGSLNRSEEYYWYFASGLTRILVAARARKAATKTIGNVGLQLAHQWLGADTTTDRVLAGPTNDVWIDPWRKHLSSDWGKAFDLRMGVTVTGLVIRDGCVVQACLNGKKRLAADYFISALPLESLEELIRTGDFPEQAPEHDEFAGIVELATPKHGFLQWMSGIQIYLREDVPLNAGHQLFLDSAWGLTSISQRQFWAPDWSHFVRDARIGGILSVDISNWEQPGLRGTSAARDLPSRLEIFREVQRQINASLGGQIIADRNILGWHLDRSIVGPNFAGVSGAQVKTANLEPLLVNHVNSWALRPSPTLRSLRNLFLSGDYVRTETDLACMEGANESARRAVNLLLEAAGRGDEANCELFTNPELPFLQTLRELDGTRYRAGLTWQGAFPSKPLVQSLLNADGLGELVFAGAAPSEAPLVAGDRAGGSLAQHTPATSPVRLPRAEWDPPPAQPVAVRRLSRQQIDATRSRDHAGPGRADALFSRWRLHELNMAPKRPVPFHVYDADTVVIHGHAHGFAELERITRGTGYHPVFSQIKGRKTGFAELWLVNYSDTLTGPYRELVINFAVSKDRRPPYRWRSRHSALVPLMDPKNRLFSIQLLLDEVDPRLGGPIEYGRKLFGLDKAAARISITDRGPSRTFECRQGKQRVLWGEVAFGESVLDDAAELAELARELGALATLRNVRQARDEIAGCLVTRDIRAKEGNAIVEVRAAYKYAPRLGRSVRFDSNPKSRFGGVLEAIGFAPVIVAHDRHLKSVLYLDGWPGPDDS